MDIQLTPHAAEIADALTDGLKELQLRADEFIVTGAGGGAEAFQRLGYGADELKAKLADPAALFEDVIDRLGRLDKAAQIRISDEVFGGTGGEQFVRLLDQGNGYIARMRQEARDTGNVLNAELVQRAIEIDRAFQRIADTVSTSLKGALVSVVALVRDFADMLNSVENQSSSTLQRRIELLRAAADNMRKSSLAFTLGGGEEGIQRRLSEADQLQAQLDSRPGTSITLNKPATGNLGDLSKIETPASKAADQLAKAYDQLVLSAEQRISQLDVERQTLGLTTGEAERLRMQTDLLNEAQRAGIVITPEVSAKIDALAGAYGDAAAAAELASTKLQNAQGMKQAFADIGSEGIKSFVSDLRSGISTTDALGNALGRLGDKLLDIGLDAALSPLLNALSGGLTGLFGFSAGGEVPSYATGGAVQDRPRGKLSGPGTGTSDSIVARVANGEFVVNAKATERNRALLEAINGGASLPAFANGGVVRAPALPAASAIRPVASASASPAASKAPKIEIRNDFQINANGGTPEQNEDLANRIGMQVEQRMRAVVVDELITQMRPGNLLGG